MKFYQGIPGRANTKGAKCVRLCISMKSIIFNNFRFQRSKFLYITRELFPMLIRLKDALHYIMQILVLTLHPNLDMMQLFNHFLFLFKFPQAGQNMINMCWHIFKRFWTRMWGNHQEKSKEFLLLDIAMQENCLLRN